MVWVVVVLQGVGALPVTRVRSRLAEGTLPAAPTPAPPHAQPNACRES